MRIVPAAPAASEVPPELIFQWERRSRAHWRLAGIIALSLLVHAVSFYVLQVAYTPTGSQLPPPAQVVMVPLDQPGNEAFARWLAMEDPALVAQPAGPSAADTLARLDFRYVPSYKAARPGFKSLDPLPGENAVAAPPRPRPPGPVPLGLFTTGEPARPTPPTTVGQRTVVALTGGIETLVATPLPPIRFKTAIGSEPLEPTAFLVGARPEGGLPFVVLKSKPGSVAADEYARDYLARLNFHPTDSSKSGVVWGCAEFAWGNDIYSLSEEKK